VPVVHCIDAVGVVVERAAHNDQENSWKLVFSGDTRPCDSLVQAGEDCTLLIHEATFEDELQNEAVAKNHATTSEAIDSAVRMRARFVMMNHFSQRYPKIPAFDEGAHAGRVGVAFDLMTFTFADFVDVPKLLPALRALFVEEEEDDDDAPANVPSKQQQKQQQKQKQPQVQQQQGKKRKPTGGEEEAASEKKQKVEQPPPS